MQAQGRNLWRHKEKDPAQRITITNKGLEDIKLMFKHMVAHGTQLKLSKARTLNETNS